MKQNWFLNVLLKSWIVMVIVIFRPTCSCLVHMPVLKCGGRNWSEHAENSCEVIHVWSFPSHRDDILECPGSSPSSSSHDMHKYGNFHLASPSRVLSCSSSFLGLFTECVILFCASYRPCWLIELVYRKDVTQSVGIPVRVCTLYSGTRCTAEAAMQTEV